MYDAGSETDGPSGGQPSSCDTELTCLSSDGRLTPLQGCATEERVVCSLVAKLRPQLGKFMFFTSSGS